MINQYSVEEYIADKEYMDQKRISDLIACSHWEPVKEGNYSLDLIKDIRILRDTGTIPGVPVSYQTQLQLCLDLAKELYGKENPS